MREKPVVLGQVANASTLRADVDASLRVEPNLVTQRDAAGLGPVQTGHGPQQGRLAGSGRSNQRERFGAQPQVDTKIERSAGEGDVDDEEIHERTSSLAAMRIAALRIISSTPIATA